MVSERCLGILTFPFTRPILERLGVPARKIIECYPVINHARFDDRSPAKTDAILNVGAAIPKKRFRQFVDLAAKVPGRECNLYGIGYNTKLIREYNVSMGGWANVHDAVQPEEMPEIYKRHSWLVYTSCFDLKTVGWPMAIAEAQASGLGIAMARVRPDLEEFLGGGGFLFDSIADLPEILSKPYPQEMRQKGFEQSKKSDIRRHGKLLTDLWDSCNRVSTRT
jgi:glycosyltransferase involved in cell wall biosynthesis